MVAIAVGVDRRYHSTGDTLPIDDCVHPADVGIHHGKQIERSGASGVHDYGNINIPPFKIEIDVHEEYPIPFQPFSRWWSWPTFTLPVISHPPSTCSWVHLHLEVLYLFW